MRSPTVYVSVDGHYFIISESKRLGILGRDLRQNHNSNFQKIYILRNRIKIKSDKPLSKNCQSLHLGKR